MPVHAPHTPRAPTELPDSAPVVRITAGAGSPAQKTWNIRKPVTLIGSRRPAGIVLHGREVSKAHCILVNTGTDLLLKDLNTRGGTYCNKERVDLAVLSDGDVIRVGDTTLQIAIQVQSDACDDSGCDLEFTDPKRFPSPVTLALEHTERQWRIDDAVVLIGRHERATIRLDHEEVSARHAVIFRFGNLAAICDLGSRTGIGLNGEPTSFSILSDGDRLGFGPLTVLVSGTPRASVKEGGEHITRTSRLAKAVDSELVNIAGKLSSLQKNIGNSWDRLNAWEKGPAQQQSPPPVENPEFGLEAQKAELDARDAMLRGYMHDVTRYHDELVAREQELMAQVAKIQAQKDEVSSSQFAQNQRQEEIDRRADELTRREHVLAQRWARMSALRCPHCGESVQPGSSEALA